MNQPIKVKVKRYVDKDIVKMREIVKVIEYLEKNHSNYENIINLLTEYHNLMSLGVCKQAVYRLEEAMNKREDEVKK